MEEEEEKIRLPTKEGEVVDRDDYLSEAEAVYQGYDEDDEITYGFSVSRSCDDEEEWADDEEGVQFCADDDLSTSVRPEESWVDTGTARDSYVINGREYKDPRQYIRALYGMDVSRHAQLSGEEQIALACIVRRGVLCECSIMMDDSFDPERFPNHLVDKPDKVLRRLKQTDDEKVWVEALSDEERHAAIVEGRAAQEKLLSCNLALVMDIARREHSRVEYLDRVQAGNEGLMKAVQYFDPYRGYKFSTFATRLIINEISECARIERQQITGPKVWENKVVTEADINKAYERMGGIFWMREITVDTGFDSAVIKRQIAVMLEQKIYMESVASDIVSGAPRSYDDVLANADMEATEEDNHCGTKKGRPCADDDSDKYDSDYSGAQPRYDIVTGDGKAPKDTEMSFEDYVRKFFSTLIRVNTVPHNDLAYFVLRNYDAIRRKAEYLKQYLENPWSYTEETAIAELPNLIGRGEIWPEYVQIEQAKAWSWKGIVQEENKLPDLSEYVDHEHPTEAMALILYEGYIPRRQQLILDSAGLSKEYCDWICEIINFALDGRLDDGEKALLDEFAAGRSYASIQDKYHIAPNTVNRRKVEILSSIYDQIIESTNRENGAALYRCLVYRYKVWVLREWRRSVLNRMVRDHYIEHDRFALRSRGEADSQRPMMETLYKNITGVLNAVDSTVNAVRRITTPIREATQGVRAILASEAYEKWKNELDESGDDSDLDRLDADGESVGVDAESIDHPPKAG